MIDFFLATTGIKAKSDLDKVKDEDPLTALLDNETMKEMQKPITAARDYSVNMFETIQSMLNIDYSCCLINHNKLKRRLFN